MNPAKALKHSDELLIDNYLGDRKKRVANEAEPWMTLYKLPCKFFELFISTLKFDSAVSKCIPKKHTMSFFKVL